MKNLTKVTLAVLVVTQLLSVEAFAGAKFKETMLTTNKDGITDPYFQIRSTKIVELTDEESMEFINDDKYQSTKEAISDKGGIITKGAVFPNIPPMPPAVIGNGNKDVTGGLVSAGGGGTAIPTPTPAPTGVLDGIIMVVDKLIAIGLKIIPTIEKGKAVVTNNPMAAVSVLPRLDTKDPVVHDMGDWTMPVTKHYKISYSNGLGSEVVSFIYSITYQYGGTYGGKGKYLTGIRASARSIVISWGFDLDASSSLIQISNVGTADNIIAGATIEISYTVKNWTKTITTSEQFFIAGDGRLLKQD
ncbi:MAG: hypothetical protein H7336_03795 [Bacteriovorax sp.]|nr:hypothetical protein [Bacteriovorax sp.]